MSIAKTLTDTNKNEFVQSYVDAMFFTLHDRRPSDPDTTVPFNECIIDNYSTQNALKIAERVLNEILQIMDKTCFDADKFNKLVYWTNLGVDAAFEYDLTNTCAFNLLEQWTDQTEEVETLKDILGKYNWTPDAWVGSYWIEETKNGELHGHIDWIFT